MNPPTTLTIVRPRTTPSSSQTTVSSSSVDVSAGVRTSVTTPLVRLGGVAGTRAVPSARVTVTDGVPVATTGSPSWPGGRHVSEAGADCWTRADDDTAKSYFAAGFGVVDAFGASASALTGDSPDFDFSGSPPDLSVSVATTAEARASPV